MTIQLLKCPRCGSEATYEGKWNCDTCAKIDRVKRMTCSHTGAHFEGNKWTCNECAGYKAYYDNFVKPYLPSEDATKFSRTVVRLKQLLDNSDKLNKVLQILSHGCDENCVTVENTYEREIREILRPSGRQCRTVLEAKAHFAKWYEDFRKITELEGVQVTVTPRLMLKETRRENAWSIRTDHPEEDYNDTGYKRNSEHSRIGEHTEIRDRQKYNRKTKSYDTIKETVTVGDWADCWNEEAAQKDQEIGFLQESETILEPCGLNLIFQLTAQRPYHKVTFTKSIEATSGEVGSVDDPIIESLVNPSQADPEEIFNRAKQIYLDNEAKRGEPIIEPESEELEESGALDQAKEELQNGW